MHEVFPPYRAMLGTGVAIETASPPKLYSHAASTQSLTYDSPVATDCKVDQQNTTSPTRKSSNQRLRSRQIADVSRVAQALTPVRRQSTR